VNAAWFILSVIIRAYRIVVSPVLHFLAGPGAGCRFEPTCSEYALQAVTKHGGVRGGLLGVRRVCRCHPWGGCGHDPVPELQTSNRVNAEFQTARHAALTP